MAPHESGLANTLWEWWMRLAERSGPAGMFSVDGENIRRGQQSTCLCRLAVVAAIECHYRLGAMAMDSANL